MTLKRSNHFIKQLGTQKYIFIMKRDRHGKTRHYFRHKLLPHLVPLPLDGEFADYQKIYNECRERVQQEKDGKTSLSGSLAALIADYRNSPNFLEKGKETRRQYDLFLKRLETGAGHMEVETMPRSFIMKVRDNNKDKPRSANYLVQVLSLLMTYAVDHGWRTDNPALNIKKLKTGTGSRPWELLDLQKFRRSAYDELNWLVAAALFTGQRESDLMKVTWKDIKGDLLYVKQNKTGKELWIPLHPLFQRILATIPKRNVVVFTTKNGHPWKADWLIHQIKDYTTAAGLSGITFHGLGKTAIGALADVGCSRDQIKAITGKSDKMIDYYMERTAKKKRARAGITKLKGAARKG